MLYYIIVINFKRMQYIDIAKVLILLFLIIFTVWSATQKLISIYSTQQKLVTINYNFGKCEFVKIKKDGKYDECKQIVSDAYDISQSKCEKYLNIVNYCKLNINIRSKCENLENNLISCTNMIVTDRLNEWISSTYTLKKN